MGFLGKRFGFPRKIIAILLALAMMAPLAQIQTSASETGTDDNDGQYTDVETNAEDETQLQPPAEEADPEAEDETQVPDAEIDADEDGDQSNAAADEVLIQTFSVSIGTDAIIVESEAEFRSALASTAITTIYLGANITMSSSSSNNIVVARTGSLVISGTDPREGGTRHTYTDYNNSAYTGALGGACANITFKDIDLNIRNTYGVYYATNTTGTTVTLDNVTGAARSFFYGRGANSILVVKDSKLTLSNTGLGAPEELASNAGKVRFEGEVTVARTVAVTSRFFNLTGSSSTVEIAESANVILDNSYAAASTGCVFQGVTNFTVGAGAKFSCYSGFGFCYAGYPLTSVTIGKNADVSFICTKSHGLSSLYGGSSSTFTAEEGSNFFLYDNETDASWSVCYFASIILNNPESFVILNPSNHVIGYTYIPKLTATGVSSIRYYPSGQISNLFNTSTYAYTPSRTFTSWWAQSSLFDAAKTNWYSNTSTTTTTTYAAGNKPAASVTVMDTLTYSNFAASSSVYGIEIYGTIYRLTFDGNNADSGTVPASDAGVPGDTINIPGNTGNLARSNYTFTGWNTQADGNGTAYSSGATFTFTKDTTLYAQWRQNECAVSGTLSGGNVSGLMVSYTIDSGDPQTVTTDSSGSYAIAGVPYGSKVVITPPAQTDYLVSPMNITISSISTDSTGNDFTYTSTLDTYTVTEKYVDDGAGDAFGQSDTYAAITAPSYDYSYGGSLADIEINTDVYVYQGYTVGNYIPGTTPLTTGEPSIYALTANETVYLVYHKLNDTTIDVVIPTNPMEFYVDENSYPNVLPGPPGSGGDAYYAFTNNSDYPVSVEFSGITVETTSPYLTLVNDVASYTPNSGVNYIHLNLELPASARLPATSVQGLSDGLDNIDPSNPYNINPEWLGTLDGVYKQQATPTSRDGYVTIGGKYAGTLSATAKTVSLTFSFTFTLVQ